MEHIQTCLDISKLKGKIAEKGLTVPSLADKIGMNKATLYRKMDDGGRTMLIKEAKAIATALNLTADEAVAIFFAPIVA